MYGAKLQRLVQHYGQALEAQFPLLAQPAVAQPAVALADAALPIVYAQADGSMVFSDEGWREVKLGRVFELSALEQCAVAGQGGRINASTYCTQWLELEHFKPHFSQQVSYWQQQGRVVIFVSDGAIWLRTYLEQAHPGVPLVLDVYHAMAYVAQAAQAGLGSTNRRQAWVEEQGNQLKTIRLDNVLLAIGQLRLSALTRQGVVGYLRANADQMDYKHYLALG